MESTDEMKYFLHALSEYGEMEEKKAKKSGKKISSLSTILETDGNAKRRKNRAKHFVRSNKKDSERASFFRGGDSRFLSFLFFFSKECCVKNLYTFL
jgi:hypothetical protein